MNLHNINTTITNDAMARINDEEDEEDRDPNSCEYCGSYRFSRLCYGSYTEVQTYDTEIDRVDWEGEEDQEIQDYGALECRDCGRQVDDQVLQDHLADMG